MEAVTKNQKIAAITKAMHPKDLAGSRRRKATALRDRLDDVLFSERFMAFAEHEKGDRITRSPKVQKIIQFLCKVYKKSVPFRNAISRNFSLFTADAEHLRFRSFPPPYPLPI
ncbi:MAG: hypothetical protein HFE76_16165 [Firmicutes bacterium]|nr:hypothetical protein [Bacillota bacterium]